jgi:surface carbohydrate biosynthesis protein
MNIYLHVEISDRELDAKLLLAVLAASKGNEVLVSSIGFIINGLNTKVLAPGIYHTKSLTPSKIKTNRHQKIIEQGSKITSIDEESGIDVDGYTQFAIDRYSDLSIGQASAVFGWGSNDTDTLKKIYSKNSQKIHKTGSPRADLWKSFFIDYWTNPKETPSKSFLLVSSNILSTSNQLFHEIVKSQSNAGYFQRNPKLFKKLFYERAEDFKKVYEFIDAIKYLAKNNNGYDIVLRPHPSENMNTWKIFLQDIPNVHIIREGSITAWVKNAFAIMHNGCTTSIEATISGKPVLTYSPFQMEYDHKLANSLGYNIKSKEELLIKVNELFNSEKIREKKKVEVKISEVLSKKLYIDDNELAAEKILKVWESLDNKSLSQSNNWTKFYWLCKIIKFKRVFHNIISKLFIDKFKLIEKNHKFPPLNEKDIRAKVLRLQHLLGIKKELKCKLLSETTILIK